MMKLERRLNEFKNAMIDKFVAVRHKHIGNDDVCDEKYDWSNLNYDALVEHLQREIEEFSEKDDPKELVDIANMAFLCWWRKKIETETT